MQYNLEGTPIMILKKTLVSSTATSMESGLFVLSVPQFRLIKQKNV
jgi:hypothetical protein